MTKGLEHGPAASKSREGPRGPPSPHLRTGPRLPASSAPFTLKPLARARCSRDRAEHTTRSLAVGTVGAVGSAVLPGPHRAPPPAARPGFGPRGGARPLRWARRLSPGSPSLPL